MRTWRDKEEAKFVSRSAYYYENEVLSPIFNDNPRPPGCPPLCEFLVATRPSHCHRLLHSQAFVVVPSLKNERVSRS